MALDKEIKAAIREAVAELRQPDALASRLEAWMEGLAAGNEVITDQAQVSRRLEELYKTTSLPPDPARETEA